MFFLLAGLCGSIRTVAATSHPPESPGHRPHGYGANDA
jgi:hypothetical protein